MVGSQTLSRPHLPIRLLSNLPPSSFFSTCYLSSDRIFAQGPTSSYVGSPFLPPPLFWALAFSHDRYGIFGQTAPRCRVRPITPPHPTSETTFFPFLWMPGFVTNVTLVDDWGSVSDRVGQTLPFLLLSSLFCPRFFPPPTSLDLLCLFLSAAFEGRSRRRDIVEQNIFITSS